MNSLSVSAIDIILEIRGKAKISCQFKRHLSPTTVGLITRSLPLEGNIHHIGNSIVYIETGTFGRCWTQVYFSWVSPCPSIFLEMYRDLGTGKSRYFRYLI